MWLMRRLAVLVVRGLSLAGSVLPGTALAGTALAGTAALILGALGAIGTGSPAALASGAPPTLATLVNSPGGALASVVPATAIPAGRVTFAVSCASPSATAATLSGQGLGLARRISMRPSSMAGDFTLTVVLPSGIQPGTYHPGIACSDGASTTARLLVPAFTLTESALDGNGVALSPLSTGLAIGGLVLLGAGAVAGWITLRRRRSRRARALNRGSGAQPADPAARLAGYGAYSAYSGAASADFSAALGRPATGTSDSGVEYAQFGRISGDSDRLNRSVWARLRYPANGSASTGAVVLTTAPVLVLRLESRSGTAVEPPSGSVGGQLRPSGT